MPSLIFLCTDELTYVNLQLNPERYTGYTGPSARRIWDAIYSENCPKCELPVKSLYPSVFSLAYSKFKDVSHAIIVSLLLRNNYL